VVVFSVLRVPYVIDTDVSEALSSSEAVVTTHNTVGDSKFYSCFLISITVLRELSEETVAYIFRVIEEEVNGRFGYVL
jgi:hypothetical protein